MLTKMKINFNYLILIATGEGINSALEDTFVLQKSLQSNKNLSDSLIDYEKNRIEDVNALSDIAYDPARRNFKSIFQSMTLNVLKKLNIVGPSKQGFYLFLIN